MIQTFRFSILLLALFIPLARAEEKNASTPAAASAPASNEKPKLQGPPADISIKSEVNRAVMTLGDPVEYTVTLKRDPSIHVLSAIQAPDSSILKISRVQDINSKEGKRVIEGRKYTLTTYKLGDFVLDPVTIQYRTAQGETHSLSTDSIYISVKSVAEGDPKNDIRGLKSVLNLPPILIKAITYSAGGIGVLLAAYLLYRRLRRKPEALVTQKTTLSPEEEAYFNLNQLFDSDLLRRAKIKEYYLRLSEILRVYFERRYGILAVEYTTDEILKALRDKGISRELRQKIQEVLESSDLAKFAKWKPEPAQIIQINQKSKQIVDDSKPAPMTQKPEETHGV